MPGKLFMYQGIKYIRLALSSCTDEEIERKWTQRRNYNILKCLWKYHSNQSLNDNIFFPFIAYRLESIPYDFQKDIIEECNEDGELNLVLNAMVDIKVWRFLLKEPIYVKMQFHHESNYEPNDTEIEYLFDLLFMGYIREFQINNNMNIPAIIVNTIKNNIKIGVAWFYCKGFNDPLFRAYTEHKNQNYLDDNYENYLDSIS